MTLKSEKQNALLASIDIDHPVSKCANYTVIESEVSDKVNNENTEPSKNINKQRFANMSTAENEEIITRAKTKNTKDNTK